MKKKSKIILSAGALIILVLVVVGFIIYRNQINSSYGKDFKGVPIYKGAKIIQDDVKESETGDTQGIRSYAIDKYNGDLNGAVKYFLDNIDTKLWSAEEVKNEDNKSSGKQSNRQFILTPTSKKIKSKLIVNISIYNKKLFVSINAAL